MRTLAPFMRWLVLACFLVGPFFNAWAVPLSTDFVFSVDINRSVRNGLAVYADDDRPVIHIFNNGNVPEQIVDGQTGRPWSGGLSDLHQLRRVYEFDSAAESASSYLARMDCRAWSVCTEMDGTTFVVMARQGATRTQLQFRVLQFKDLFASLENALAGRTHDAPQSLSTADRAALDEIAKHGAWVVRFRDALRGIQTQDQYQTLQRSTWMPLLKGSAVLGYAPSDGFPLQRDVELAACRALVVPAKAALVRGESGSGKSVAMAMDECRRASKEHFYMHIVDWLMDAPSDARPKMAKRLASENEGSQSEDFAQLVKFLGGLDVAMAAKPPQVSSAAPPVAQKKVEAKAPGKTRADSVPPARANDMTVRQVDPEVELAAINAVPNQIVLLSFSERGGLVQPDASSLSGTVFRASVEGGDLERGAFRIDAVHNLKSAIRMAVGRYRVKLKVKLFVARVDRCVHRVYCLTRPSESRSSKNLVEVAEFYLRPENTHRDSKVVRFGPLKPSSDSNESDIYQSQLSEVRLVIELDGRISPQ